MPEKQPDREEYEYGGLMAASWDLLRGDTSNWPDRHFFLEVVKRHGQPVLDVGCGTGRLLLDFMAQGVDIDGVDNSPEMLALLREKAAAAGLAPTVYLQTMETLDLPRRYRTIMVPSSSFQLVLDPAAAREAMRRFYAHLLPGGALAMPFMRLYTGDSQEDVVVEDWGPPSTALRPDGLTVRRTSRSTFDRVNSLEHTEDRYDLLRGDEVVYSETHRRSPATREYTWEQAVGLFQEAGFEQIEQHSRFSFDPPGPDDDLRFILGLRPRE